MLRNRIFIGCALLCTLLFFGCSLDIDSGYGPAPFGPGMGEYYPVYELIDLSFFGLTESSPVTGILGWINNNSEYVLEGDGVDEWQIPIETVNTYGIQDSGVYQYAVVTGDCEDFVLLAMYVIHNFYNAEVRFVYSNTHAWIEVNGVWWETGNANIIDQDEYMDDVYKNAKYLSYGEAMYIANYVR